METKKPIILTLLLAVMSCNNSCIKKEYSNKRLQNESSTIIGTWKLISGTTIKGKDTLVTDYTQKQEMIKIINETHFAFLRHDLEKGRDSTAIFVAGGGKCSIKGNKYIEHLQYFNEREWEGNSFEFEYMINSDTLITQGVEEIEALGINYFNIEKYYRVTE